MFDTTDWNWEKDQPKPRTSGRNNSHRHEAGWADKGATQITAKCRLTCLKVLIAGNGQPAGWFFINTNRLSQGISHIALQEPWEFIKYSKVVLWIVLLRTPSSCCFPQVRDLENAGRTMATVSLNGAEIK